MDEFVRVAKDLGLPYVALFMAFFLCLKIGSASYEGLSWFGPQFLVPIRDGLIGNITVLTAFITEMRKMLPLLEEGHNRTQEAVDRNEEVMKDVAKENAKTRATMRATVQVISGKCPEAATQCPFKQKSVLDSDKRDEA